MMESRELDRRRGWPWKNRKNLSASGSENGSSPAPVKLFDEQEVARILQDQVRICDEQMVEVLHEADSKHAEKEKSWTEKLAAALAEITIKDSLVKQHIKVAEEAVVGWEKAESEAAELKAELENMTKRHKETEERAKHLDGAMNEIMQQLQGGREEHEKRLHDTIVKKTREFDKLRLEMEAKLSEMSKALSDNRTRLVESQAENEALNHTLKDRSRMISELNDIRAHAEMDSKILRVRLEGLEKENFDFKYKVHSITKKLEINSAELEYGKKTSDVLSRHHAESIKKIARLEDECNRLRVMVRKKLPNPAAIVRMKQELDALGKEVGDSGRPRRRPLIRSQSGGVDYLPVHELVVQEDSREADHAQRIANMEEETRMVKEALAKRNDELQQARIMCAKTASRLTAVEDELEAYRSAASTEISHFVDASSGACSTASMSLTKSPKRAASLKDVLGLSVNGHYVDTELRPGFSEAQEEETASENGTHSLEQSNGFESVLRGSSGELQVANRMCEELRTKLISAENQLVATQSRNAANEQSVITLQERLNKLLESQEKADEQIPEAEVYDPENLEISEENQLRLVAAVETLLHSTEALAKALEIKCTPEVALDDATASGSISKSLHWESLQLEISMSSLVHVANKLLEGETQDLCSFVSELSSTISCITGLCTVVTKDHDAVRMQISQLEELLQKVEKERSTVESQMKAELNRVLELREEIEEFQA